MTQTKGEKRRQAALDAGVQLWATLGEKAVTARSVGRLIGLTHGGVLFHFGTSAQLVDAVAAEAVRVGNRSVVPMLITSKHPSTGGLTGAEKAAYLSGC